MQLISRALDRISEVGDTGGGRQLALVLASACSSEYTYSALDCSVRLDSESKLIASSLLSIAQEIDFSNASQDAALRALRALKYIK